MTEEVKMLAPCASLNALSLPKLKRKRSDSVASDAPAPTKSRLDNPTACSPTPPSTVAPSIESVASLISPPVASANLPAQAASDPGVNQVHENITGQLHLEVLLKHNELRLIDQEIAKCQIALEQLRRCAEIPYPGSTATGPSTDVSAGVGASVLPAGNGQAPVSPAPWGVTDGPYTRHYAQWLLPDPRFDGGEITSNVPASTGSAQTEGRSTRGNPQDFSALAGKAPRSSRTSTGANTISTGGPVIKEKPGPLILRRKSDNVLVKLVCLNCEREDFSSTQGFINHCRIGHLCTYASHEAAAVACGQPVELDEHGLVVGDSKPSAPEKKKTEDPVHHLIRANIRERTSASQSDESATPRKSSPPGLVATPTSLPPARHPPRRSESIRANASFLPSPATPHLSALVRKRGLGFNMNDLVEEARTPVDLSGLSDDESGDESRDTSMGARRNSAEGAVPGSHQPMRIPVAEAGPEARKGLPREANGPHVSHDMTPSRPQLSRSSLLTEFALTGSSENSMTDAPRDGDGMDHPSNLSPHAIESNQAPSLVSDYEDDYGAVSDSDSPAPSEDGDEDQDFRHIEVQDDERTATPATTTEPKPGPGPTNPTPQSAPPLSKPLMQSRPNNLAMMPPFNDRGSDDKHVNFVHRKEEDPDAKPKTPDGRNPPNL